MTSIYGGVPFLWRVRESGLLTHLTRTLSQAEAHYSYPLINDEWHLSGVTTLEVIRACEEFIANWEVHKPEVVEYRYRRKDVAVFRRAIANLFPHRDVPKPLPGLKHTLRLYGARSEHKRFQELLLEEEVNAVFSTPKTIYSTRD